MVEDDFIQEEYEPKANNSTYIESIKFNDDFTTKSTSTEKKLTEKNEIAKPKFTQKEPITTKPRTEKKEEPIQKKLIKTSSDKEMIPRSEKVSIKKKPVQNKINNKPAQKNDEDTINISFNFMKKIKIFFKKQDKFNMVITLVALIAIVGIALLILNLDKIFPDKGVPVAFVNNEMITTKDLADTIKTIPSIYRSFISEDEILNQTIANRLLLQESNKIGIIVSDDEVQKAIDKTIANAQISKNDFKLYLAQQNMSYEDMELFYKNNLIIEKLAEKTAYIGINITQKEVKAFYINNSDKIGNLTLEDVQDQVESYLLQQKKAEALRLYVERLVTDANIRILKTETTTTIDTDGTTFSSADVEKYASCATENGLDKKEVIFIYSDSCPHCQKMKPIITDLQGENYKFKWASVSDNEIKTILSKCYADVLVGGVPQFICARNGQTIVGQRTKEIMKEFAASCNQ